MYKIVGWSLGNDCPYRCEHCYSFMIRNKGKDICISDIDLIIKELKINNTKTVVLGGNEPIFTNGINPKKTLLPYIIKELRKAKINPVLISSGYSTNYLFKNHLEEFRQIEHVITSFDSPFEDEHNNNRGANLFDTAIKSLEFCKKENIKCSILMVAQKWNFERSHIDALLLLAKNHGAYIRINKMKAVEKKHQNMIPNREHLEKGFNYLFENSNTHIVTDPSLAVFFDTNLNQKCYCGNTTSRINSISPQGVISISPCIYMHKHKLGDIKQDPLKQIEKKLSPILNRKKSNTSYCWAEYELNDDKHNYNCERKFKIINDINLDLFEEYICTWIGSPK